MTKARFTSRSLLSSVGWPILGGLFASLVFYWALHNNIIGGQFLKRYTAGHPVEYVELGMFFIGLTFLLTRVWDLVGQFTDIDTLRLPEAPATGESPVDCGDLLTELDLLPSRVKRSYLGQRIRSAIDYVHRSQTANQLDDELKYLSENDSVRAHEGYALVRIIIWATPMLGFLGTVMGITLALGDLSPEALVNAPTQAMEGLLAGLSVAFDTTALALTLSIALMFAQFLSSQTENQLLVTVDRRVQQELGSRFQQAGTERDPHVASIERMAATVVRNSDELVKRQSELWESSITSSQRNWLEVIQATSNKLKDGIAESLQRSTAHHSSNIMKAELEASQRACEYWSKVQESVRETAEVLRDQQTEMAKQSRLLERVVNAVGEVSSLESSLNQNLKALSGAKNFEDTVMSLSAAIHLLNSRLGKSLPKESRVDLLGESEDQTKKRGHAA